MENNRYEGKIKKVEDRLLTMCFLAQKAIEKSIIALKNKDKGLAKEIIINDKDVDDLNREIENSCLNVLLMYQPYASEFREISGALKMITDLERIGDYAVDIAEIVLTFKDEDYIKKIEHIPLMGNLVIDMVKDSVQAFINKDYESARLLNKKDDKVDEIFAGIKEELVKLISINNANIEQAINFMMIAKYLERIGDHAVNIGEWVDYEVTGSHQES